MARLAPDLPADYLQGLLNLKSMGAVVMVLALKHQLSTQGYYWYSLPKNAGYPFLALVEHTNFVSPEHFGGDHIVYVGDYLEPDHEYFKLSKEELLERFLPELQKFNSNFNPEWVRKTWLFRAAYAQPVPLVNHSQNIPAIQTPINGSVLRQHESGVSLGPRHQFCGANCAQSREADAGVAERVPADWTSKDLFRSENPVIFAVPPMLKDPFVANPFIRHQPLISAPAYDSQYFWIDLLPVAIGGNFCTYTPIYGFVLFSKTAIVVLHPTKISRIKFSFHLRFVKVKKIKNSGIFRRGEGKRLVKPLRFC